MGKDYLFEKMLKSSVIGNEQKIKALKVFLVMTVLILLPFSILNYLFGDLTLALIEVFFGLLAGILFFGFRAPKYYTTIANLFLFMTALLLLIVLFYFQNSGSRFVWIGIFPIASFFLLGSQRGINAHILFSFAIFLLFVLGWHGEGYDLSTRDAFNIIGGLIAYGVFIYLYEVAKNDAFEMVYKHSFLDELTGIGNRKMFVHLLSREKAAAHRHVQPLTLIMIDLDFFKKVNDQYGHMIGDKVLIAFTQLLKKNLRRSDLLFRWGGEEFIILLPHESEDSAQDLAEKLRTITEQYTFEPSGNLTASFGITEVLPGESDEETIRRLDSALYRAKENGRNRIEVI